LKGGTFLRRCTNLRIVQHSKRGKSFASLPQVLKRLRGTMKESDNSLFPGRIAFLEENHRVPNRGMRKKGSKISR